MIFYSLLLIFISLNTLKCQSNVGDIRASPSPYKKIILHNGTPFSNGQLLKILCHINKPGIQAHGTGQYFRNRFIKNMQIWEIIIFSSDRSSGSGSVCVSVCLSVTFMNYSLNLHLILEQSQKSLRAVSEKSQSSLRAVLEQSQSSLRAFLGQIQSSPRAFLLAYQSILSHTILQEHKILRLVFEGFPQ